MTRVAMIGANVVPYCTEQHLARAFREDLGCQVLFVSQDNAHRMGADAFVDLMLGNIRDRTHEWTDHDVGRPDLVMYTRTHNATALGQSWTGAWQKLKGAGIVTASVHLDRFFDLQREHLVHDHDPLFTTAHVFTADGGNAARFANAGVHHHWLAPGVDRVEAEQPGVVRAELTHDVVFFGSGARTYHGEYPQRGELLEHLRRTYRGRFHHYGHGGDSPVVRQQALNDAIVSAKIVIGDSCFANEVGSPRSRDYWSDRIAETIGRAGFLLHPWVPGIRDHYGPSELATYAPGDFADLDAQIGMYLANPGEREGFVERGRARVLRDHTYSHRMAEVLRVCGLGVKDPLSVSPDA